MEAEEDAPAVVDIRGDVAAAAVAVAVAAVAAVAVAVAVAAVADLLLQEDDAIPPVVVLQEIAVLPDLK